MASEDENQEVTVRAPSKSAVSSEKKEEKTTEKALETERFGVLQFPKKVSRFLGLSCTALGAVLLALFAYMEVTSQTSSILLSAESGSAAIALWVFVGLFNVVVGFLFLGRD